MPAASRHQPEQIDSRDDRTQEDEANLAEAGTSSRRNDYTAIDTPGSDSALSRAAHSRADTLISPLIGQL